MTPWKVLLAPNGPIWYYKNEIRIPTPEGKIKTRKLPTTDNCKSEMIIGPGDKVFTLILSNRGVLTVWNFDGTSLILKETSGCTIPKMWVFKRTPNAWSILICEEHGILSEIALYISDEGIPTFGIKKNLFATQGAENGMLRDFRDSPYPSPKQVLQDNDFIWLVFEQTAKCHFLNRLEEISEVQEVELSDNLEEVRLYNPFRQEETHEPTQEFISSFIILYKKSSEGLEFQRVIEDPLPERREKMIFLVSDKDENPVLVFYLVNVRRGEVGMTGRGEIVVHNAVSGEYQKDFTLVNIPDFPHAFIWELEPGIVVAYVTFQYTTPIYLVVDLEKEETVEYFRPNQNARSIKVYNGDKESMLICTNEQVSGSLSQIAIQEEEGERMCSLIGSFSTSTIAVDDGISQRCFMIYDYIHCNVARAVVSQYNGLSCLRRHLPR